MEKRSQRHGRSRHAGVMLAFCCVVLTAVAAGGYDQRPPRAASGGAPDGALLFRTYCASCHGTDAKGAGPAAVAMRVMPPDLTKIVARNKGAFPAERMRQIVEGRGVAAHGERSMPVWGDVFMRHEHADDPTPLVEAIVKYLDGLQERATE